MRVAVGPDGCLFLGGHGPGRGAWLCRSGASALPKRECFELARSRRVFSRALRRDISAAALEALAATTEERARMGRED